MHISNACAKDVKHFALLAAALVALIGPAGALAQEAPSVELPAVEEGALPSAPVPTGGQAAGSAGALLPDPCPMPSDELSRAPDDLAKVQADIDRYTLCMERAQLLQRLNDVAMENQEKLNQSSGVSSANPGMQLDGPPSMESIRAQIMDSIGAQTLDMSQESAPAPSNEWMIIKVSGSSGGLAAQLGKSDGTLSQVRAGDSLPDGSQVNSVSATAVTITQNGERKELRWHQGNGT